MLQLWGRVVVSALLQGTSSAITEGYRMELLIHSPHPDFLSLSWDSNPLPLALFFSLLHLLSGLHGLRPEWALWRITLPRCNPIKKKSRNWFLIFVRCCISPHLWEDTASIISHLITLSKNGYRTAAVSASRGLTCTSKSNWRLYLMYLFKIWK